MPNLISQEDRASTTLEINRDPSGQMMSHDIPIQKFWEIIFSPAGAHYLNSRGLIIGNIVESSSSTSANLFDLPNTRGNINIGMHRGISDILNNPIQLGSDLVLPPGTNERSLPQNTRRNVNAEQNIPVESEDSDPSEEINISKEGENINEIKASEKSLETLNNRVSNNGSIMQSSSNGGYETQGGRLLGKRMIALETGGAC